MSCRLSRCYLCFVLFRFRLLAFSEAAALCSIVIRYACAPATTRIYLTTDCVLFCFYLFLFSLEVSLFPSYLYHYRFLLVSRVRRTFFTSGWCFTTLWPRAGFLTSASYERIQSTIMKKDAHIKASRSNRFDCFPSTSTFVQIGSSVVTMSRYSHMYAALHDIMLMMCITNNAVGVLRCIKRRPMLLGLNIPNRNYYFERRRNINSRGKRSRGRSFLRITSRVPFDISSPSSPLNR